MVVDGRDITPTIDPRLISMTLTEARSGEADQLDIELSDHDGALAIPSKDALITLALGWKGQALVDKGSFVVDEVEHSGAPDRLSIKARSADMQRDMRKRVEKSWHDTTLGAVVGEIAAKHGLTPRIGAELAGV